MALRLRRGTDAERQLITPVEGELVYTTDTKSVYIGDGVTAGGIIISGEIGLGDLAEVDLSTPPTVGQVLKWDGTQFVPSDDLQGSGGGATSIFDLSDVFQFSPPDPGDILIYDGANFVPERIRFIYGDDSSRMVNTANNTFTGIFDGDGSRLINVTLDRNSNYEINIIGSDSSLLLDSVNGIHYGIFNGTHVGSFEGRLAGTDDSEITSSSVTNKTLVLNSPISNTAGNKLVLRGFGGTVDLPTEPSNFHRQGIAFEFYDGLAFKETGLINSYYKTSGAGYIAISPANTSGTFFDTAIEVDGENQTILISGSVVANGSASFDGTLTAGSFKGSLVADDSTTIVDAINGTISASGYIQFGSYTTTDRDLLVALNGMVIYNTTVNRFQGYQNGAWINLDDGTAA